MLLLIGAPSYLWEIYVKSDLMSNIIIFLCFILLWHNKHGITPEELDEWEQRLEDWKATYKTNDYICARMIRKAVTHGHRMHSHMDHIKVTLPSPIQIA